MNADEVCKLVVSQGVLPAIKVVIDRHEKGKIDRHAAVCGIADIINYYNSINNTGESKLTVERSNK